MSTCEREHTLRSADSFEGHWLGLFCDGDSIRDRVDVAPVDEPTVGLWVESVMAEHG